MPLLQDIFELIYVTTIKLPVILRFIAIYFYGTIKIRINELVGWNLLDYFKYNVKKYPNKECLVGVDGQSYTFEQLDKLTDDIGNAVCRFLSKQNHGKSTDLSRQELQTSLDSFKGKSVAILTENTPMVIISWLSMHKIGLISGLMNFNLKKESLEHCFNSIEPILVLYDKANEDKIDELSLKIPKICLDDYPSIDNSHFLQNLIMSGTDCLKCQSLITNRPFSEKILYIFTSGTTGLPKAAIIRTTKFFQFGMAGSFSRINSNDRIYTTIPLYHSNSGIVCVSQMFLTGSCLIVRKKFSVSNFIDDCLKYNATVFNYVGELCRYLISAPYHPNENLLKLRIAIGNGMRANIWTNIYDRFKLTAIAEFYGSTEGNAGAINLDSTVGACGFIAPILQYFYPMAIVKYNEETKEILKDSNGRCILAKSNEPGMAVVKIDMKDPLKRFDGYYSSNDSKKKIQENLFRNGDRYFVTGDVLKLDRYGYLYFIDRTGDTFRWKGENVSTFEVETILMNSLASLIQDSIVFGVEVGKLEGKAGMVAINLKEHTLSSKDVVKAIAEQMTVHLAPFARPLFVRIIEHNVATTSISSTCKFDKKQLVQDSFNPNHCNNDSLFYWNTSDKSFQSLDNNIYDRIMNNQIVF